MPIYVGQDSPVTVQLCIDSQGHIDQIQPGAQNAYQQIARITQQIESIKTVNPPPPGRGSPLCLSVKFSSNPRIYSVSIRDFDWGPYMAEMQRYIKRHWLPPPNIEFNPITLSFQIFPDGNINNLTINRSSGQPMLDQMSLVAIQNSAPLRPLPDGFPDPVDIQFTLDCNHARQSRNF